MEIGGGGGGGGNGEMGMPSNREALDPLYHQRRKLPPRSDQAPAVGSESEAAPVVAPSVRYRECQKNHAAAKGGHVVDGCGEFMPCGDDGSPDSLKCAACECHRNFHRKEVDGHSHFAAAAHHNYNYNPAATITITPPAPGPGPGPIFPARLGSRHQVVAPVMMAFGGAAESSSEDLQRKQAASGSRKRFRTKFSQEQKEKMMGFAEKVGWKIQKQDDKQVHQFCDELGLKRQVLKVWMHNNKPNTNKNNQPL